MDSEQLGKMRRLDLRERPIEITGLPWVYSTGSYDRIPEEIFPETLSDLYREVAKRTCGGFARVRTNSGKAYFKATVKEIKESFFQMSRTARSGFDVHIKYDGEPRRFLINSPINYGHCSYGFDIPVKKQGPYDTTPEREGKDMYELLFVFPISNNVEEAVLYLEEDAEVLPPEPRKYSVPVLFYGSSIEQGAGAGRPSMCYTNRVSLDLDCTIINFGCGGQAHGELEMAELCGKQDMGVFVMAYDHNAETVDLLKRTHAPFFKRFREFKPEVPVIITTKPDYGKTLDDNDARRAVIRATYEEAVASGDRNVYFLDGKDFFEGYRDQTLTDMNHPNDLGYHFMALAIEPLIKKLLEGKRP